MISVAKPESVTADWTKVDLKARAKIMLPMDDSQPSLIRNCTSVKDRWHALTQYHDKRGGVPAEEVEAAATRRKWRHGDASAGVHWSATSNC